MKKILLLLLIQSICHANIYNGNTDAIASPRDLSLNPMDIGQQDASQTTSVKNYILTNLSGQDRLRTFTTTSQMVLENTTLELDGTYTFTHGSIKIIGNCAINGSSDFNKFRFESHLIHIENGSELRIGPGVNFEYAPTSSIHTGIRFGNSASKLVLEDSILTVSNRQGLNLVKGQLKIEGNSTVDNFFTEDNVKYLDRKTSFTETALILGNGVTSYGDCKLNIMSGSKLTVKNAGIVYRNNGVGSFAQNGTLIRAKNSSFLIESDADSNGLGITLDSGKLNSTKRLGNLIENTGITSITTANFDSSQIFGCEWSPDGKYLLVVGPDSNNNNNQIYIYSFDGSSLTLLYGAGVAYNAAGNSAYTGRWSPDGKYIAVSGIATNKEIQMYSFTESALINVGTGGDYSLGAAYRQPKQNRWSPNGKYLAACGWNQTTGQIQMYRFDGINLTSLGRTDYSGSSDEPRGIDWSPDGKYIIFSGNTGTNEQIEVYNFTGSGLTPSLSDPSDSNSYKYTYYQSADVPYFLRFSPNGKYVIVCGITLSGNEIEIYSFDEGVLTLLSRVNFSNGNENARIIDWSPDGKYLAIAGTSDGVGNQIQLYRFDGTALTSIGQYDYVEESQDPWKISWSPDGKYLAIVGWAAALPARVQIFRVDYLEDDLQVTTMKNSTLKLDKDLTLRDINLNMK